MINLMKRLAELDAQNTNIVKEFNDDAEADKIEKFRLGQEKKAAWLLQNKPESPCQKCGDTSTYRTNLGGSGEQGWKCARCGNIRLSSDQMSTETEGLKGDIHPDAEKVLKHIKPEHHNTYTPYLKKGVYKGDYKDRADVLSAAEKAGHAKESVREALDNDLVGMVQSTIEDILSGAQQGQDMTDNIADELGDHFDAVQNSGDKTLQQAYSIVRDAADTSPEEQAQAAQAALEMLSGDQGMDEGWKEKLGALGTAAAIGLGSMGAAQPAQAAPATPTTASAQQQQAVYQGAYRMAAKFAQTNKNFAQEFKKLSDDHKEHVSRIEGSSFMNPSLKKQNDQKMQKLDSQFKMDIQNLLKVYGATNEELAESLDECGMMGGMNSQPHSPATINMTADSGAELTGMLKDIMQLAGLKQITPHDLGHEHEPAVISAEPGISVANVDKEPLDMKSMLAKIDSMNAADGQENDEGYEEESEKQTDETIDSLSDPKMVPVPPGTHDPAGPPGAAKGRGLKTHPVATPDLAYESLMTEYKKFISEN